MPLQPAVDIPPSSGDALPHGFLHLQRKLGWEHTFACLALGAGNEEGMSSMHCSSLTPLSPGAAPREPELPALKLAWLNPSHGSPGRCEQRFKPGLAERKELEICLLVLWFVLQQLIQDHPAVLWSTAGQSCTLN